ncbi:MAG: polyamine aminopropyltransferase [Myxococcota bacterium]
MSDESNATYTPSSAGFEHEGIAAAPAAAGRWFTEPCDEAGTALSWRVEAKLHEERSEYQQVAIYQTTHFGRLMVIDGFVMVTTRDNFFYHEMLVHPAMFMHPDPQHVVVIGGGDCGTLQQVLRHPGVKRAHQIEIDPRVTDLAIEHFPELAECRHDPRAELTFEDGIAWMARAEPGSVDVIIVDSTDPIGPAVGLYEVPFLRSCYEALGADGILVQQSGSPFLHLDTELRPLVRATQGAGFSAVSPLCFPQPCYAAGWWSCTLASKRDSNDAFREQDAAQRPFVTRYYNEAIHRAALATPQFFRSGP